MTEKIKKLLPELKKIGNQMYAYYGGPVYLIGSALRDEIPRDIDIRVVVSEEDFKRLFGDHEIFLIEYSSGEFGEIAWKWTEDRLKRCRILSTQINESVDFNCMCETMWRPENEILRLDTKSNFNYKDNKIEKTFSPN